MDPDYHSGFEGSPAARFVLELNAGPIENEGGDSGDDVATGNSGTADTSESREKSDTHLHRLAKLKT